MPRNFSAPRVKAILSETLDHRLKMYSIAAAAAGVGVLALAQPAVAEVVITQTNIPMYAGSSVGIDLNHDGIPDFQFTAAELPPGTSPISSLFKVTPLTGGAVFLSPKPLGYYAAALQRLARIGPLGHFSTKGGGVTIEKCKINYYYIGSGEFGTYHATYRGNWYGDLPNRYLGVKFLIDGQTHYGWVRLTVRTGSTRGMEIDIHAYAYETVPDRPIVARVPQETSADTEIRQESQNLGGASLGMLALGADGLALWRRDEALPI